VAKTPPPSPETLILFMTAPGTLNISLFYPPFKRDHVQGKFLSRGRVSFSLLIFRFLTIHKRTLRRTHEELLEHGLASALIFLHGALVCFPFKVHVLSRVIFLFPLRVSLLKVGILLAVSFSPTSIYSPFPHGQSFRVSGDADDSLFSGRASLVSPDRVNRVPVGSPGVFFLFEMDLSTTLFLLTFGVFSFFFLQYFPIGRIFFSWLILEMDVSSPPAFRFGIPLHYILLFPEVCSALLFRFFLFPPHTSIPLSPPPPLR